MRFNRASVATLLVRAALAVPVAYHGAWNLGQEGAAWWASSGLPAPLRFVVGPAELCASLAVFFGVWIRPAAAGLILIFLGAIPQHIANGFSFKHGGIEPLVVYLLLSTAFLLEQRPLQPNDQRGVLP